MKDTARREKVVTALTDAATVTVNTLKGDLFTLETPGGAGRTIDGPTGGYDGQIIEIRCKNTHGSSPITHTLDVAGADSFRYPTGFSALPSIAAGAVHAYVAQYHAGDAKWDLLGISGADFAVSPGGSTEQLQYNNGGAFGGAANVTIVGGNINKPAISIPSAPASGLTEFVRSFAGRYLPAIIGPSGMDTAMQAGLHGNSIFLLSPASGTAAPSTIGGTLTTAATLSLQFTAGSSNRWSSTARKRFQTSTTAGNASGMRTAYTQWFRGNAAGFGGFFFRAQFGASINLDGGQKFIGLCAATGALGGEPSALVNMCGCGYNAADASTGNWFFMRNDGSGTATKVDLGTDMARGTTQGFELIMFLAPNSSDLYVLITNLNTGVVVLDTMYDTDLPAVNTGMAFSAQVRNGAVAAADNLEVAKVYIETDY